jgi:diamine N-acetyltransferase
MSDATDVAPDAQVSLREVTAETLFAVCQLSNTLTEPQRRMVAPNAYSIAEAHFARHAWFRAIYADEVPVGFLMLHDSLEEEPGYLIWRLMIGGPYQGMGFGRRAVALLIDYVRTRPGAKELLTSCGLGEGSPEGFYLKLGFRHTGKMHGDEAVLSLRL